MHILTMNREERFTKRYSNFIDHFLCLLQKFTITIKFRKRKVLFKKMSLIYISLYGSIEIIG